MMDFKGQIVWITGASSGLGEALAIALAHRGCRLILTARRTELLNALKNKLPFPDRVGLLPFDLQQTAQLPALVQNAWDVFGGLDTVFLNAGLGQWGTVQETTRAVEEKIFAVNYHAPVALTKALLPLFRQQKHGHIVAITSMAGRFGQSHLAAYSASKAALEVYMESTREEVYSSSIQVQWVIPGNIQTHIMKTALTAQGQALNRDALAQAKGMKPQVMAEKIIAFAQTNGRKKNIGGLELLALPLHHCLPRLFYFLLRKRHGTH